MSLFKFDFLQQKLYNKTKNLPKQVLVFTTVKVDKRRFEKILFELVV